MDAKLLVGGDSTAAKIGRVASIFISQTVSATSPRPETGYVTPNGLWVALNRTPSKQLVSESYLGDDDPWSRRGRSGLALRRPPALDRSAGNRSGGAGHPNSDGHKGGDASSERERNRRRGKLLRDEREPKERRAPPDLPFKAPGSYSGWGTCPPEDAKEEPERTQQPPPPPQQQQPASRAPPPLRPLPPPPPPLVAKRRPPPIKQPPLPAPSAAHPPAAAVPADANTEPRQSLTTPRDIASSPASPAVSFSSGHGDKSKNEDDDVSFGSEREASVLLIDTSAIRAGDAAASGSDAAMAADDWHDKFVWSEPQTVLRLDKFKQRSAAAGSDRASRGGENTTGWLFFDDDCFEELSPRIVGRKIKPPICPRRPDLDGRSELDERKRLIAARRSQVLRSLSQQRGEIRWRKPQDLPRRSIRCW